MTRTLYILLVIVATNTLYGQNISIETIPYEMCFYNEPLSYEVYSADSIEITSGPKTDLFTSPFGNFKQDKSPKLLFKPDSNFVLTAKIIVDFTTNLDAGVLLIYNDTSHYAKFCFEQDYQGQARIITVVCNETTDGCKSIPIEGNSIYFRIAQVRPNGVFAFYSSTDNKSWFFDRIFTLNEYDDLKIGFSAQSPKGEGCKVLFSNISLAEKKVLNFRTGE